MENKDGSNGKDEFDSVAMAVDIAKVLGYILVAGIALGIFVYSGAWWANRPYYLATHWSQQLLVWFIGFLTAPVMFPSILVYLHKNPSERRRFHAALPLILETEATSSEAAADIWSRIRRWLTWPCRYTLNASELQEVQQWHAVLFDGAAEPSSATATPAVASATA
jgi:hypothetical protein